MMTCERTMNSVFVRFIDSTHFSTSSCPPSSANAAEKIDEPTNSQHTIALVLAVRNDDSRTVSISFDWRSARTDQTPMPMIAISPNQVGTLGAAPATASRNQTIEARQRGYVTAGQEAELNVLIRRATVPIVRWLRHLQTTPDP